MTEQWVYTTKDIADIFQCGRSKSLRLMREIKKYGDRLEMKGRIAKEDFELWFNRNKKENKPC